MKNTTLIRYTVAIVVGLIFFYSCDNDDSGPEFVTNDSDFSDFRTWTEVATNQGPDPALGGAHEGLDADATRTIYIKDDQDRGTDGRFPVGTLIVKDTRKSGSTVAVTALAKRGNGFNPDNNDWEWFMLSTDGAIIDRGAKLMSGACGACHTQAQSQDFVFSK